VPIFLILCLLSGAAFFDALTKVELPGAPFGLGALILMAVIAKMFYWNRIDRTVLPSDRAGAVGLPGRRVRVFEAPHTEANYITREMAFRLARRYSGLLRGLVVLLLAALPVLFIVLRLPPPLTAASILTGIFIERWLFFAEARHVVTLYY
jgi:DMSO reductase anchor subunit